MRLQRMRAARQPAGRRAAFALLLTLLLAGAAQRAAAQGLSLETWYGGAPANADRVLITTGDGRWQELEGEGGSYRVELGADRYMLAVVCFESTGPNVTIYRFPVVEHPHVRHVCVGNPDLLAPHHELRGQVAIGPPSSSALRAQVSVGRHVLFTRFVRDRAPYEVKLPADEAYDVVAFRMPIGSAPDRAVLVRGLSLVADTFRLLDLGGRESFALEPFELTAPGPAPATLSARLVTCNGTYASVAFDAPFGAPSVTYAALPPEGREACDRYELSALQQEPTGSDLRAAFAFSAEPADTALQLPSLPASPVVETVGVDPLRARLSWAIDPEATLYVGVLTDGAVTWSFVQSPSIPPAITLPPWGADLGVRDLRGADHLWGFGRLESSGTIAATLHAWEQSEWFARGGFRGPVEDGLRLGVSFVSGQWVPPASEAPGP